MHWIDLLCTLMGVAVYRKVLWEDWNIVLTTDELVSSPCRSHSQNLQYPTCGLPCGCRLDVELTTQELVSSSILKLFSVFV